MTYAGFDTYAWPGVDAMAWLKANTNLSWCGFYLAPAPSHPDVSWMPRRATLVAQGWGVAPLFLGQQLPGGPGPHHVEPGQGTVDGALAASLMAQAAFAPGSCCYLDLEEPGPAFDPYVVAWSEALVAGGYRAGVYCSHVEVDGLARIFSDLNQLPPQFWAFKVQTTERHDAAGPFSTEDPAAGSGCPAATAWQHDQNAVIEVNGRTLEVDLSTSALADPGAP